MRCFLKHDEHLEVLEETGEKSTLYFTQPLENNESNRTRYSTVLLAELMKQTDVTIDLEYFYPGFTESFLCSGHTLLVRLYLIFLKSFFNYTSCSGIFLIAFIKQNKRSQSKLYCWYEHKINKYWFINPLKIEKLHTYPDLVQVYDFMGSKAMNEFRERASEIMIRSEVASQMNEESDGSLNRVYSTNERTSFGEFFREKFPLLDQFQRRVEMFTGFSLTNPFEQNEYPQVVSYTSLGSHFSIHEDRVRKIWFLIKIKRKGNR